eukprot:363766-Chlamydomonas_euryale.AAC.2
MSESKRRPMAAAVLRVVRDGVACVLRAYRTQTVGSGSGRTVYCERTAVHRARACALLGQGRGGRCAASVPRALCGVRGGWTVYCERTARAL